MESEEESSSNLLEKEEKEQKEVEEITKELNSPEELLKEIKEDFRVQLRIISAITQKKEVKILEILIKKEYTKLEKVGKEMLKA